MTRSGSGIGDQPEVIINGAAYTAVDKAEEETDIAEQVNAGGDEPRTSRERFRVSNRATIDRFRVRRRS